MALPSHLSKKLRQTFGPDAGADLVTWLEEMRAERAQLLSRLETSEARLALRIDSGFTKVDERFAKVDERLAGVQVAIAESKAELMKWMLVFWVGAVGAIAALAGVLRG
jgi:hypothetical protein